MKNLSYTKFNKLHPRTNKWPSEFLQVDSCQCIGDDFFRGLDKKLKKFGLEILMADLGDDSYTFKIIDKGVYKDGN